jgi:hypothetical protein
MNFQGHELEMKHKSTYNNCMTDNTDNNPETQFYELQNSKCQALTIMI